MVSKRVDVHIICLCVCFIQGRVRHACLGSNIHSLPRTAHTLKQPWLVPAPYQPTGENKGSGGGNKGAAAAATADAVVGVRACVHG